MRTLPKHKETVLNLLMALYVVGASMLMLGFAESTIKVYTTFSPRISNVWPQLVRMEPNETLPITKNDIFIPESGHRFEVLEGTALEGKELYVHYVDEICSLYYPKLDPAIVKAVIECESNWIPTVQSNVGAVGLMQVLPKYHARRMEQYGLTDIWDPYANILVGADLLNELHESRGDYYNALLGYNNSSSYARHVLTVSEKYR